MTVAAESASTRPDMGTLLQEAGLTAFLVLMLAGWVSRNQQEVIEYLQAENRVLREQLGGKRLRFTDAQRRQYLIDFGQPLYLARLSGAVVRGPVGENE